MVSVADFATPAPPTETSTKVCVVTGMVKMLKPPVVDPAGIVTLLLHVATDGLLHVTGSVRSDAAGDATVTVAKEPFDPVVGFGLSVSDAGGCCGVSVSGVCTVWPFQLAPMVTVVVLVTALVGILRETDWFPPATVAAVGGLAAGELLERLTTAPPGGAAPVSITITEVDAPPVMGLNTLTDLSAGGCTVKLTDAEVAPSVAVSATGVGALTAPTWKRNWPNAKPAGTVNVAGTGAAVGLLLERDTTAPPGGAGAINWTETVCVSPFAGACLEGDIDQRLRCARLVAERDVLESDGRRQLGTRRW